MAEFVHTTSRLARDESHGGVPDPQLHSHVLVIAAKRRDGQLAAVESKQLFRSAPENGAWYRAELAANLGELGLGIDRRTGREAQEAVSDLARSGELVRLQDRMWTTRELREREQEAIRTVRDRGEENAAAVSDQALREARHTVMREIGSPMTDQQNDALEQITGWAA